MLCIPFVWCSSSAVTTSFGILLPRLMAALSVRRRDFIDAGGGWIIIISANGQKKLRIQMKMIKFVCICTGMYVLTEIKSMHMRGYM